MKFSTTNIRKIFHGIIPEKYRHFPGNFRKNSAGNFRKFPNSQPYRPVGGPWDVGNREGVLCVTPKKLENLFSLGDKKFIKNSKGFTSSEGVK